MATLLRFPDRLAARSPQDAPVTRPPASIVILPCIRREALDPRDASPAQRQA